MKLGRPLVLILALVIAANASAAAPPIEDPQANVVPDLVVQARSGGPAWWRVSSGAASVWVLGVPGALPRGLKWDQSALARRLNKARWLIVPPTASIGIGDIFGAFALQSKLKTPAPFEATLPSDLAARYLAAAALLRQKPGHYDRWKPAVAGLIMVGDFRRQAGLDGAQPVGAIRSAAARAGVRVQPAAAYKALPMARSLAAELSQPVNLACLGDALQEIEAGAARVRVAAAAWASGDVRAALTAERGYERCLAALPDGADLVRRGMADEAGAIARALRTPGITVAVVDLRSLLAQGGVLERLRAQGYAVKAPDAE
ncbi:MAG: TraB/GumN family protein, partial [Caulobacterales bacterium]